MSDQLISNLGTTAAEIASMLIAGTALYKLLSWRITKIEDKLSNGIYGTLQKLTVDIAIIKTKISKDEKQNG